MQLLLTSDLRAMAVDLRLGTLPQISVTITAESQISTPFTSMVSRLQFIGQFETSSPNDPKMALNATKSKVPHKCPTSTLKARVPVRCAVRPVVFELQVILVQVHQMISK